MNYFCNCFTGARTSNWKPHSLCLEMWKCWRYETGARYVAIIVRGLFRWQVSSLGCAFVHSQLAYSGVKNLKNLICRPGQRPLLAVAFDRHGQIFCMQPAVQQEWPVYPKSIPFLLTACSGCTLSPGLSLAAQQQGD
jgi:hypothetical protein